jgi:pyruvate dehydrogenase E1 component beta subunit
MRVAEELNSALHDLLSADPSAYLLGEDIADPYGGAFKVTRGLSTRFPDRVLTTPISEAGITGVAGGLALRGNTVIVEMMFADFVGLAFDQIVNFAAKSVSMYGTPVPMRMIVRCPSGGRRGYGATHSQSLQKHFIGVPDLSVHELSPVHPAAETLARIVRSGAPALLVEDKSLYPAQTIDTESVDDLFSRRFVDADRNLALLHIDGAGDPEIVIVAGGGMVHRCLAAARRLTLQTEQICAVLVPAQLYPLDLRPAYPLLSGARLVAVAEESSAGGTWGNEVAVTVHRDLWGRLRAPVVQVSSGDSIIPAAPHLEAQVLVQADDLVRALTGAWHD